MLTTYYHPHISGLTLYFQRLAEEYVKQGHEVTMLTAQHDKSLKLSEQIHGVKVVRTPCLFKINKGMFLHRIWIDAWKPIRDADVLHINLPSVEALPVAILAKISRKPIVSTYVCDITLPKFLFSKLFDKIVDFIHFLVLILSDKIVSFTKDFAENSRVLKPFAKDTIEVYPIVEIETRKPSKEAMDKLTVLKNSKHPRIGMATRIAADKGIDVMIDALITIWKRYPETTLFIIGTINAVGEEKYLAKLQPLLKKYSDKIKLLGSVEPEIMPLFFQNIDVLVVASTNSTEAFGMVQVESMLEGTPVVATNLPGVRIPIEVTGYGKIANIGDSKDLAQKIIATIDKDHRIEKTKVNSIFNKEDSVSNYLEIYNNLVSLL